MLRDTQACTCLPPSWADASQVEVRCSSRTRRPICEPSFCLMRSDMRMRDRLPTALRLLPQSRLGARQAASGTASVARRAVILCLWHAEQPLNNEGTGRGGGGKERQELLEQ
eukprot:1352135-Pleurochrysis_carterae.AAC.1